MGHSNLLGPETPPQEPAGRDNAVSGPGDSSDAESNLQDEGDNIPGASPGEPRRPPPEEPNPAPDRPEPPGEDDDSAGPPADERDIKERHPGRAAPPCAGADSATSAAC